MVRDFNLSNVVWVNILVVSPGNSISQHFGIQNEYFDLFTTKGFYWFIEEEEKKRDIYQIKPRWIRFLFCFFFIINI